MKKLMVLTSLFATSMAFAALKDAPPGFGFKDGRAVYVDFETASYEITFDFDKKTAIVESEISFQSPAEGYAIFDLVAEPLSVSVDGQASSAPELQDPDRASTLRALSTRLASGKHTMKIRHQLTTNTVFGADGVATGFWTSDLNDRRYLEQYLPTNLEFDQYQMTMTVDASSAPGSHVLKANGIVTDLGNNKFQAKFPKFYSASSVYFHLFRDNSFVNNVQFYLKSIDGRSIPVDIYTSYDVQPFVDTATAVFHELEADYGPWPHQHLIVYGNAPSGGMEYSGATITSLKAVGHEMMHSYHARGLMPSNGNAGWMDEAMARWRDNSYPLVEALTYSYTRLAGRSAYTRMTDRMAYTEGSAFLGWIGFRMNEKGLSMRTFLRDYFQKYKYTTVTTQLFQKELSAAAGMDLSPEFDQYIYGKGAPRTLMKSMDSHSHEEDPMHPKFTKEQLLKMTWL